MKIKQLEELQRILHFEYRYDIEKQIYSCITNHTLKNGIVTGFEARGTSIVECVNKLIETMHDVLTEREKAKINKILESEIEE